MPAQDTLPSSTVSQTKDVVSYEIRVDGTAISGTFKVLALTVREAINKIPSAQITLVDGSASDMNFESSDTGQFKAGRKIEILIGYDDQNEKIFGGIIISNIHKVHSRGWEMQVECRDERIKMTITRSGKNFENITDADLINQLLQANGLAEAVKTDSSAAVTHEQLVQWDVTDWDYMMSRVDASDLVCHIHNGTMSLKKPDWSEDVKLTLTHGLDMLEFTGEVDSRIQTQDVETISWDYKDQKIRKTTGNDPDGSDQKKDPDEDSSHTVKEVIDDIASVLNKPFLIRASYLDEDAQQKITDSKKMRQSLDSLRGKVKYFGSILALPADMIELKGVGSRRRHGARREPGLGDRDRHRGGARGRCRHEDQRRDGEGMDAAHQDCSSCVCGLGRRASGARGPWRLVPPLGGDKRRSATPNRSIANCTRLQTARGCRVALEARGSRKPCSFGTYPAHLPVGGAGRVRTYVRYIGGGGRSGAGAAARGASS